MGHPTHRKETSGLKRKLRAQQVCLLSGNHDSANMIDFVGSLGLFDGVWIDMEHSAVSMGDLADMSRAAELWGMASIVRVRAIDPALIALTLDQGVDGIIVPHVGTRRDAEAVVDTAKFPPLGHRGAASGRKGYGRTVADHLKTVNDESFIAVMIEDAMGVENLPEILQVPHIDMVFVSHYDLAQSIGMPGEVEAPELVEIYDKAIQLIAQSGSAAAAVVKEGELAKYLGMGVLCLKAPNWQNLVAIGASSFSEKVRAVRPRF